MTAIAYVPGGMSSKSQRACIFRIFMTITFVAECRNSVGKPTGDSKRAHATARFANISTAHHTTHRTPLGIRISGSLVVEATADFRMVDSFMIFLAAPTCRARADRGGTRGSFLRLFRKSYGSFRPLAAALRGRGTFRSSALAQDPEEPK